MDKRNKHEAIEPVMNFTADPDAVEQLHKLAMEMQDICMAHNIPMVLGLCIKVEDGKHGIVLCSYIDSRKTPAPDNMLGAVEMIRAERVSPELVRLLEERNNSTCDCEACKALAGDEPDNELRGATPGVVLH